MLSPPVGGGLKGYLPVLGLAAGCLSGGCILGAATAGTAYVLHFLPQLRAGLGIAVILLAIGASFSQAIFRLLPERSCQVPGQALAQSRTVTRGAFRWGVTLGLGVRTFVVTPGFYALLAIAGMQVRPVAAVGICAVYGLMRGITILGFAVALGYREARGKEGELAVGLRAWLRLPIVLILAVAGLLSVV